MKAVLHLLVIVLVCEIVRADPKPPTTLPAGSAIRDVTIFTPQPFADAVRQIRIDQIAKRFTDSTGAGYTETSWTDDNTHFGASNEKFDTGPDSHFEIDRSVTDNAVEFRISADFATGNFEADENKAVDQLVETIKAMVAERTNLLKKQLVDDRDSINSQYLTMEQRKGELSDRLRIIRKNIEDAGDPALAEAQIDTIRAMSHDLDAQLESNAIDIAGKTARQKALADAIARLSDQMQAKLDADPIARQLQMVVDARQAQLDQDQSNFKAGAASPADISQAGVTLAEAKAALLERKEAAAKAAGADSLDQWNRDLLSLSVDLAELSARSDAIKSRITTLGKILQTDADGPSEENIHRDIEARNGDMNQMNQRLQEIDHELHLLPAITVVDPANPTPPK